MGIQSGLITAALTPIQIVACSHQCHRIFAKENKDFFISHDPLNIPDQNGELGSRGIIEKWD